jgi:hypothetical protein
MTMQQAAELLSRLDRLERENRKWKRVGVAALALAAVGALGSAFTVCDSVSAERFIVRDSRGKERVRLTAYETGGIPKLSFLNDKGQTVFSLGVCGENKGYIEVQGANGLARSAFAVQDGRAILDPVVTGGKSAEPRTGM